MHRDQLALTLTTFLALSPATLPHRSHASDPTITHLEKAWSFAFGGVGFVSAISQSEMDYRAILSRKSAAADFETVFQFGNIQAKCYALTGLRQVDPSRFQLLAATLQSSTICVPVTRGCQTFNHPMAEVINQIRSGIYSGPMTHDLIPDRGPAKPPPPDQEQTTWRRCSRYSPLHPANPTRHHWPSSHHRHRTSAAALLAASNTYRQSAKPRMPSPCNPSAPPKSSSPPSKIPNGTTST